MKIDLAVYTAVHGYDWQPGTVYSGRDLVRYKRGMGDLPDPLMEELPFGGVFNDGDTVVFYRYHMAIKSDSKGRDSLYLVLGTLPKSKVGNVDFKELFDLPEFAKPMKPAPVQVTYTGFTAKEATPDFSEPFRRNLRGSVVLSEIGTWFSHLSSGTLSMRISGTCANPVVNVRYDKPKIEEPKPEPSIRSENLQPQAVPGRLVGYPDYNVGFPSMPSPISPIKPSLKDLMLPVIAAFLVGAIIGGFAGWFARDAKKVISTHIDRLFDSVMVNHVGQPKVANPQPKPHSIGYLHEIPIENASDLAKEGLGVDSIRLKAKETENEKDRRHEKDCDSRR